MNGLFKCTAVWLGALLAFAVAVPLISPRGGHQGEEMFLIGIVLLQVSALGIVAYCAWHAWKARRTPGNVARYAIPPLVMLLGFGLLGPLVAVTTSAFGG